MNDPSVPMELLLAQRAWVRALARRLVADENDAADLEQQVWVDALRSPPVRDGGIRGWFATLLRRRARDAWRGEERRDRREGGAARPDWARPTADVVAEAEAHRMVVSALLELEDPYRETLILRFYEDLPPRGIAARQRVPVETVRTRTRRGLEMLRERMVGPGGGAGLRALLVAPLQGITGDSLAAPSMGHAGGTVTAGNAAWTGGGIVGTKVVVAAATAGAVVGGLVAGVTWGPPPGDSGTVGVGAASAPVSRSEHELLGRRLAALEARAGADAARGDEGTGDSTIEGRLAAGEERLAAIEAALAERAAGTAVREATPEEEAALEAAREALRSGEDALAIRRLADQEQGRKVQELRRIVADSSKPELERTKALTTLRFLPDGIDDEVVTAVVGMFRDTTSPGVRVVLIRDLHGRADPVLRELCLDALRRDESEFVRERAARDLDTWREEPSVRTALEAARDGDASERVRTQARRTLEGGAER